MNVPNPIIIRRIFDRETITTILRNFVDLSKNNGLYTTTDIMSVVQETLENSLAEQGP